MLTIIAIVLAVVSIGYLFLVYNRLIEVKNATERAFKNIDVAIVQRHDEIPKLVEVARKYMEYEGTVLKEIMDKRKEARSAEARGQIDEMSKVEGQIGGMLGNIFALAEDYPELKADSTFAALTSRISDLESMISDRREVFNESVEIFNARIESLPDLLLAGPMGLSAKKYLKFEDSKLKDIDVRELFKS